MDQLWVLGRNCVIKNLKMFRPLIEGATCLHEVHPQGHLCRLRVAPEVGSAHQDKVRADITNPSKRHFPCSLLLGTTDIGLKNRKEKIHQLESFHGTTHFDRNYQEILIREQNWVLLYSGISPFVAHCSFIGTAYTGHKPGQFASEASPVPVLKATALPKECGNKFCHAQDRI